MSRPSVDGKRKFLAAFAVTGMVHNACEAAGVERTTCFRWRKRDPKFALAFERARSEAAFSLEEEARRRAVEGVRKYKFKRDGLPILHPVTGEAYYELDYSDALLALLLKANNPSKFQFAETAITTGATAVQVYLPSNERDKDH